LALGGEFSRKSWGWTCPKGSPSEKRRRTRNSAEPATATPDKIDVLAVLLRNIYWNGFEHRGTNYRIARSKLRDLAGVQRLEAGTMKKLIERVREDGFILYPVDKSNYASASQWIFDKLENHTKLPLADTAAIQNAEERSERVS
jgi:hypothetical protein